MQPKSAPIDIPGRPLPRGTKIIRVTFPHSPVQVHVAQAQYSVPEDARVSRLARELLNDDTLITVDHTTHKVTVQVSQGGQLCHDDDLLLSGLLYTAGFTAVLH